MARRRALKPRLRYERPWREHEQLYVDLFANDAVAASLWPGELGGARTRRQAVEILEDDVAHWQRNGFGPWACFERTSGAFVARGGLRRAAVLGRPCIEVLYAVRTDAWGHGYASEIATVAIAHARELGLTDVVGLTLTTNVASRRVLEKVGMRFERQMIERAGLPHLLGRC